MAVYPNTMNPVISYPGFYPQGVVRIAPLRVPAVTWAQPESEIYAPPPTPPQKRTHPRITAWRPGDEARSWGVQKCLKAITWYQEKTRTFKQDDEGYYISKSPCPFSYSCSEFTADAIRDHGVLGGIARGTWRIFMICNPITRHVKYGKAFAKPREIKVPGPDNKAFA